MKQNKTVIGLVGGSGSGKGYVGDVFAKNGCYVIDADIVAREVVMKGEKALDEIREAFGIEVIDVNGNLIRKNLAHIVFNDKSKLDILNAITHKYIRERMFNMTNASDKDIVVWDAPTLFEAKMQDYCDYIVCVTAPLPIRVERITERDNLTHEEALERIKSQKSEEFLVNNSDFIIDNSGEDIDGEVENILFQIKIQNN